MPIISSIDGPARRVYLSADTVGVDLQPIDMYKEMRTLRRTDENLRKYPLFMEAEGNEPTGPDTSTQRFVRLLDGTRVVPFDTTQVLNVVGTIITDDGQSGVSCFDRSPLSQSTVIDINYTPPQVEVIRIVSGSGVTEQDKTDIKDLIFNENVETGENLKQALRLLRAESAGVLIVNGNTISIRNPENTKDRITATVDNIGNRSNIITDPD